MIYRQQNTMPGVQLSDLLSIIYIALKLVYILNTSIDTKLPGTMNDMSYRGLLSARYTM